MGTHIKFTLKGKFELLGPLADYGELIKRVCCLVTLDITQHDYYVVSNETQYMVASVLYDKITTQSTFYPSASTEITKLRCIFDENIVSEEHLNERSLMHVNHLPERYINYYVNETTSVAIKYNLDFEANGIPEREAKHLEGYIPLSLKLDNTTNALIAYMEALKKHSKLTAPLDFDKFNSAVVDDLSINVKHKLYLIPPTTNESIIKQQTD